MNLNIKEDEALDLGFANPEIKGTPTLFVGKIILGQEELEKLESKIPRELYLFAAVVKTGEVHFKFGELKRLELILVEKNLETGESIQYHLTQHNSIMYKNVSDHTDNYECVDMLKKKDILYLHRAPKWKASEASIPKYKEKLFYFSTQFYIPENKTNKTHLGWDETLYVFLYATETDQLLVEIFIQDTSGQTAEDHYKLEEMMAAYDACYNNPDKVHQLLKKGDKYFHDYVLEHKRTSRNTLESLLTFAKTKKMETEVSKRLALMNR
ncbi:hypothetical protein DBR43_29870 [Pedobacter sp. KBW06]|uniref:hypothetical protein n=1 Tax=Pedobacter sp. KBW06 TaxID=2153359 RepID=UPI000F5A89A7|nr:hypothetical protein [Pedobacter sp. KBW06]RQO66424.1 hypothetical protein DBR43_29870 [Pedobacter sp. KBW06]